jgi:hypothetical protein
MSLNFEVRGTEVDAGELTCASKAALLYALGVGVGSEDPLVDLQFTTENSQGIAQVALPTFAVTIVGSGMLTFQGDSARDA